MFTQSDGHTRKWWPGEFRLVHRVTFGSELRLELVCMNTGTTPFRFEEALHTYNRIANIQDARCGHLIVSPMCPRPEMLSVKSKQTPNHLSGIIVV